jgi:hypothetical protein
MVDNAGGSRQAMHPFKALTHSGGVPARGAASSKHYTYFLFYNHWGTVGLG